MSHGLKPEFIHLVGICTTSWSETEVMAAIYASPPSVAAYPAIDSLAIFPPAEPAGRYPVEPHTAIFLAPRRGAPYQPQ